MKRPCSGTSGASWSTSLDERVVRITRVRLRVGALCHVSPETLRSRWQELVADTPARDSALEIESAHDTHDVRAQDVVLADVVVEEPGPGAAPRGA